MKKLAIVAIVALTAAAWAVEANAQRCSATSCGGVIFPVY